MNELIRIDTTEQGSLVVSARLLYAFLEPKTRFDLWIDRMVSYGFTEGQDYAVTFIFEPNPKGGKQRIKDYALTIDTAKEISMLQRTAKGKQARQYFIDCEKALYSLIDGEPNQLIVAQAQRIDKLERQLSRVVEAQKQAAMTLLDLPRSSEPLPLETTRMKVKRIVNAYCRATGENQQKIWRLVYQRLYYLYRIRIRSHKRSERESWLDVADRKGYMEKIYAIVGAELILPQQ
jgi:anti-repressor protein